MSFKVLSNLNYSMILFSALTCWLEVESSSWFMTSHHTLVFQDVSSVEQAFDLCSEGNSWQKVHHTIPVTDGSKEGA